MSLEHCRDFVGVLVGGNIAGGAGGNMFNSKMPMGSTIHIPLDVDVLTGVSMEVIVTN